MTTLPPHRRAAFTRAVASGAAGTAISRVLGALRDRALARFLGAGDASDTFFMAFTIPNMFRRFVADEGLTGALLPATARTERAGGAEDAAHLARSTFIALVLANALLCAAGHVSAPWLVSLVAGPWADEPAKIETTVRLTRAMFPLVAMFSFVSFFEAFLNHRGRFFLPKVAPAFVSMGMIAGSLWGSGVVSDPIDAIVVGTMAGGLAHTLLPCAAFVRMWGLPVRWEPLHPEVRTVGIEMAKVAAIGLLAPLNLVILRRLAAALPTGSMTYYWNANRLVDLAQGTVAVAIGSALLPALSVAVADRDWSRVGDDGRRAFRLTAFVLFPAAAGLWVFAEPTASMLYRTGAYSWSDVQRTVDTLVWLVPYMLAIATIGLLKRVFFALDRRGTLLVVGSVGVIATAAFGHVCSQRWGVAGLAAGLSIATWLQAFLYGWLLQHRVGLHLDWALLFGPFARIAIASLAPTSVLIGCRTLADWSDGATLGNIGLYGTAVAGATLAYFVAVRILSIRTG